MMLSDVWNTPFVLKNYKGIHNFFFSENSIAYIKFWYDIKHTGNDYSLNFGYVINDSVSGNGEFPCNIHNPNTKYRTKDDADKKINEFAGYVYETYIKDNVISIADEPLNRVINNFKKTISDAEKVIADCERKKGIDFKTLETDK